MSRTPSGMLSYFTRHRTLSNLVLLVMIVAGIAATTRIRAQFFPDVEIAEVTVSVRWPGAGAEDVDRAIVQVMEPSLLTIDGVTDTHAYASEGRASITLEFEPGFDLTRASEEVQTAVDAVTTLPKEVDPPEVRRGAWRDRVTDVVIAGPVSIDQLGRFADDLVRRLYAQGITRTSIRGLAAPKTVVEVPSANLIRYDITMADIATAIAAEVQSAPAGDVSNGASRVRTGTERRSAEDIAALTLRLGGDGTRLTIGDVATVRVETADRSEARFVGPDPAMTVRVNRNATGDAIRMQAEVQDVVTRMQSVLPPKVTLQLAHARAELISGRLRLLLTNAAQGLVLVVGLLFLFLNARTALWVAAGIPVSMLAAIAVMYAFGLTLNMISLFALIITLGIVVDDAIVVGEHTDFRAKVLGETPVVAAERAAQRMWMPVVASTVTTVIAFAGLVAIGGRFGSLISDIPFTVIAVLVASLVECFLILPSHMKHALDTTPGGKWYDWPSRRMNRGLDWLTRRVIRPAVAGAITARFPVIALAILLLMSQIAQVVSGALPFRFFNAPEQSTVSGNFAMLPGARRDDTMAMMHEVQRATDAVSAAFTAKYGAPPGTFTMAQIGGSSGRGLASADTKDADQLGGISVELSDPDTRSWTASDYVEALQAEIRPTPLLEELSFRGGHYGPGGDALSVDLSGADADVLKAAAEALKTELSTFPEASGLEDSLAYDKEELILSLTPQGQALGFSVDALSRALRDRLNGIEAATYPDGLRSATIRVEVPDGELTADFLDSVQLKGTSGTYVPLADLVTVERRTGFSTIRRENGLRIVSVTGDLAEDDPARAEAIQAALATRILPKLERDYGITTRQSGLAEQQAEFLGDAQLGLIFCLLGIYMILAWVFSSWTRPVVVMVVIPFGLIGAIWGHAWWGVPLSMFSIVGMIGMTGIIINDSIVLVSTIDEYAEKRGLVPAIVDGVCDRFRPVMLTTATTVLGLAPLLYEGSSQAEFLRPTVITLCYGLGFGLILVLLLVPAVLAVQTDIARQIGALRFAVGARSPRARRARAILGATALALAGAFAATLGAALVTGQLPLPLRALSGTEAPLAAALLLFVAGTVFVTLVAYAAALVLLPGSIRRGRSSP